MKKLILLINTYFQNKELVRKHLGFINFIVGGKTNTIQLNPGSNKGIDFEVPRSSLVQAIKYQIFDDLLIGNFMKTTLHNLNSLYSYDFNFLVTKYGDNGKAQTEIEVKEYLKEYKRRAGRQYIYDSFYDFSANIVNRVISDRGSKLRRLMKSIYYKLKW